MTRQMPLDRILADARIVSAPAQEAARACTDRSFELPPALHIATAALFLGFVGVLCLAFSTPGLAVPFGVFVAFIVAFFTVPALWARMAPDDSRTPALSWDAFLARGIDTATGRTPAGEAATLVLVLPVLIFCWAIAIAIIAAVVG